MRTFELVNVGKDDSGLVKYNLIVKEDGKVVPHGTKISGIYWPEKNINVTSMYTDEMNDWTTTLMTGRFLHNGTVDDISHKKMITYKVTTIPNLECSQCGHNEMVQVGLYENGILITDQPMLNEITDLWFDYYKKTNIFLVEGTVEDLKSRVANLEQV